MAEQHKTIEGPVQARIVPFSSVVGQSVMLTDETGAVVAQLSISIPDPSYPYRETAEEIACIIATAISEPPTALVKKLRGRLSKLMADEAKRMAASELATPSSPVSSPSPAGGVREALRALYEWYDRDGSVGGASEVFEQHRAALSSPATGEVVEALREARNYVDDALADAERDLGGVLNYPTLRAQKQAWVDTVKADLAKIDAALNPAPGHGEGVPVAGGEDHG